MKSTTRTESAVLSAMFITAIAALAGCQGETAYVEPPPPPVKVTKPMTQDVTNYLEATGYTEATETVEIRARVQGYLDEVKFQAGDDVSADDILYVIDKRPFIAERNIAAAQLTVAEAERVDAEAKVTRARPLAAEGAMSQEELGEKEATFEVAKASIEAAKASLESAELELSYTDVRTPIDGRVGRTLITKGNLVGGTLATHLTTVISYDPIYVYFNISESELLSVLNEREQRIQAGEEGRVKLSETPFFMARGSQEDFQFEGRLEYADLGVESGTGTYMIRGLLSNEKQLVATGMFVRIRIPVDELKDALVVPEQAVGYDQRGRFLLTVGPDNVVERKNVKLGRPLGNGLQVVLEGLEAGDRVIYEGQQRARVGSPVDPQDEPFEPASKTTVIVQPSTAPVPKPEDAGSPKDVPDEAGTAAPEPDAGSPEDVPDEAETAAPEPDVAPAAKPAATRSEATETESADSESGSDR